jgi:hypothetical protein
MKKREYNKSFQNVHLEKTVLDYLFDFFMLFIAVTLGFFSNNLREDYLDRRMEKEYINSLIYDIGYDTASIRTIIRDDWHQIMGMDTLLKLFEKDGAELPVDELYRLCSEYLNTYTNFTSRDITINQMKNAGELNLIHSKAISDSILSYYNEISSHQDQFDFNGKSFQDIVNIEMELFDYSVYRNPNRKKIIHNPNRLNEFYNRVLLMGSMIQTDRAWLKKVAAKGSRLSNFLLEEYKVKVDWAKERPH